MDVSRHARARVAGSRVVTARRLGPRYKRNEPALDHVIAINALAISAPRNQGARDQRVLAISAPAIDAPGDRRAPRSARPRSRRVS
jgi:hypothetical protein